MPEIKLGSSLDTDNLTTVTSLDTANDHILVVDAVGGMKKLVPDDMTVGTATQAATVAAGGRVMLIGPFEATLAGSQTAAAVTLTAGGKASIKLPSAGTVTKIRGILSEAVTGTTVTVTVQVNIAGTPDVAYDMDFTSAGSEVDATVSATSAAFTAAQAISLTYDSDGITNNPDLEVWIEVTV